MTAQQKTFLTEEAETNGDNYVMLVLLCSFTVNVDLIVKQLARVCSRAAFCIRPQNQPKAKKISSERLW